MWVNRSNKKEKINYRINHKNTMVMIPVCLSNKRYSRLMCCVVLCSIWMMLNHAMPPCVFVCSFVCLCTFIFIWFDSIPFHIQQRQSKEMWSSCEQNEMKKKEMEDEREKYERAYHSFWTNNNCYCCNRLSCCCCYWFVHSPNQNAGLNVMINYRGIPSWKHTET